MTLFVYAKTNWWFYRKGSEIWANHNYAELYTPHIFIGDSTAKVVKFEQITTGFVFVMSCVVLVILPQR